jgi:hypothetical protein
MPPYSTIHATDGVTKERGWPTADGKSEGRVNAECQHQAALILGVNELVEYHPTRLAQIVATIQDRIKIIGIVENELRVSGEDV